MGIRSAGRTTENRMTDTERIDAIEGFVDCAAALISKGKNYPCMGLKIEPAENGVAITVLGSDDMVVAPTLRDAIDLALQWLEIP